MQARWLCCRRCLHPTASLATRHLCRHGTKDYIRYNYSNISTSTYRVHTNVQTCAAASSRHVKATPSSRAMAMSLSRTSAAAGLLSGLAWTIVSMRSSALCGRRSMPLGKISAGDPSLYGSCSPLWGPLDCPGRPDSTLSPRPPSSSSALSSLSSLDGPLKHELSDEAEWPRRCLLLAACADVVVLVARAALA